MEEENSRTHEACIVLDYAFLHDPEKHDAFQIRHDVTAT